MVAIVTGTGLGLLRDSGSVLGNQGQLGTAGLGQSGETVTVNAANGNLIIQRVDEILLGRGPDDIITNTYNSQGTFTSNGWQESFQRHTGGLTGTVNTANSTITHYAADGSAVVYNYDPSKGLYVGNEAGGAYDTMSFDSTNNQWIWTEGKTRIVDVYDNATGKGGRLVSTTDTDGNSLTYAYDAINGTLTSITTANNEVSSFTYIQGYNGKWLISTVCYGPGTSAQTLTGYEYDTSTSLNRLTKVTVDLTPENSGDSSTYVTNYGYDGTSDRIASITQSDGTSLAIAYVLDGSTYKVSSLTQTKVDYSTLTDITTMTSFSYTTGATTITDAQGNVTTMSYDSKGQLTKLVSPPAAADRAPQVQVFTYDTNGNLTYSGPAGDPFFTNIGANWGDVVISQTGVTTTQTTETDDNLGVYRRVTTGTTVLNHGTTMRLGQSTAGQLSVAGGQNVQFSVYAASSGVDSLELCAIWRKADGTIISTSSAFFDVGGTLGTSGVLTAKFGTLSATAPSDAVRVEFMVRATATGGAGVPMNIAITEPTFVIDGAAPVPAFKYTYNANGNLASKTDIFGNQTLYTYDGNNQLVTKTTTASGMSMTSRYIYDSDSHLIYAVSPLGEVTQYAYNSAGQQTAAIQYTGGVYDLSGLQTTDIVQADALTAWIGTGTGNGTGIGNGNLDLSKAIRTDTTYDPRGAIATVKTYSLIASSGSGFSTGTTTTTYVYDHNGQLLGKQITTAAGTSAAETFIYDGLFRLISATDFNGTTTATAYTNQVVKPVNGKDMIVNQTIVTLADGTTRTSTYDVGGELVAFSAAGPTLQAKTYYSYDSNGNLVWIKDPTGLKNYMVYDELNRKVADVAPDGSITVYRYNAAGQIISTTAYATKVSTSLLSNADQSTTSVKLSDILSPNAATSDDRWNWNIYDADGRLVETIDAQGAATTYAYDDASRLIATTAYATPLLAATVTAFKTTPPAFVVLPDADSSNDRTTHNVYDKDSRLVAFVDASGYLTQYVYDATGNKIHTIAYATKPDSSVWSSGTLGTPTTNADDIHNWFVYDARGDLRATIDGEGVLTSYDRTYTATSYTDTVTTGQKLNTATLIATPPVYYHLPAATGTPEVTASVYDLEGHILSKTQTLDVGTTVTSYTYDAVYNLTSTTTATVISNVISDARTMTTKYDELGRVRATLDGVGSAALAMAGSNQTAIAAAWATYATDYAYDTAGRLISKTDADNNATLYYYDVDGQLTYQVVITGTGTGSYGEVVKYGYDIFGEKTDVTAYANKLTSLNGLTGLIGGQASDVTTIMTSLASAQDSHSVIAYDITGTIDHTTDATAATTSYTYNAFGDVLTKTDPLSIQTSNVYSRRGLLLSSTSNVSGHALTTTYAHDAFGRVMTVTDANSSVQSQTYDHNGRIKTQVDALGKTTTFTYDGLGHVLTTTDRTGAVTTYAYGLFDRTVTVTDPNGVVTTTTNNAYGQTIKIVDGNGTTTYEYDADGNLTKTTDGAGNVTTRAYDAADFMTGVTQLGSTTSPLNVTTNYTYDAVGRVLTQIVDAGDTTHLNLTTTWTYDGKGQTVTVTDPTNVATTYTYDLDGRKLTSVVDPTGLNLITTWTYDTDGRILTMKSPQGQVTAYGYDEAGHMTSMVVDSGTSSHLNLTTAYTYDYDGNLKTATDPAGNITRYTFDAANRLTCTIDPTGGVTFYKYDDEGRVVQTILYTARNTTTGYQSLGSMVSWTGSNPAGLVTRTVYDKGRKAFDIDPAGAVMRYNYDSYGRLLSTVDYDTLYSVAGIPALTDMAAWGTPGTNDRVTRYVYDTAGRQAYVIDPNGSMTSYTYDGDNRVVMTVQYAVLNNSTGDQTVQNMLDWITNNTNSNDRVTRCAYDAAGREAYAIRPSGAVTGYTYDADGRVTQTTRYAVKFTPTGVQTQAQIANWYLSQSATGNLTSWSSYDAAGRMTYEADATGAVTAYKYDKDGHVLQTIAYATLNTSVASQTLASWAGSHASANDRTTRYTYDTAGRLVYAIDAAGYMTAYTLDGNGRTTRTDRYGDQFDIPTTSSLPQSLNNMTTWVSNHGSSTLLTTQYSYDGDGRVMSTTDPSGAVTGYTYNTAGQLTKTVQYFNLNSTTPDARDLTTLTTVATA